MSTGQTLLLGAVAGLTIFVGLPLGRMRTSNRSTRTFLSGASAGILVFLLFDILEHATEPLEDAAVEHEWVRLVSFSSVYLVGLGVGLLGLLYVGRTWRRSRPTASIGPGAMAVAEADLRSEAFHVGMAIAVGIGLHNFSEGLAIGQTARAGEVSLALLLVIGFALHNGTEGFGIVGPLTATGEQASWKWLATAGLVAGGPTFLGTVVGSLFSSELLFVAFLALAAGAILYVIGEMFNAGRRLGWTLTLWGVFVGFAVGLATELVVVAAGA